MGLCLFWCNPFCNGGNKMSNFEKTPLMLENWYLIATNSGLLVGKLHALYDCLDGSYIEVSLYNTILKIKVKDITYIELVGARIKEMCGDDDE